MAKPPSCERQGELFAQPLPHGLVYQPDFLSEAEEAALLAAIAPLGFREARFKEYFARRRVVFFHGAAADTERDDDGFAGGPLPPFLKDLERKAAAFAGVAPEAFVHALVSEYRAGTPIGWHRDQPGYGIVVGVSLAGWGRMRFRPLVARPNPRDVVVLDLAPRSVYIMQGPIRWQWQHSMPPTRELRYSITFRTRAG